MKLRQVMPYAIGFLAVDIGCWLFPSPYRNAVSYLFQFLAPLLATLACAWKARRAPAALRPLWLLLLAALVCFTLGVAVSAWGDVFQHVPFGIAFISDFVFFFYGVPLLFALSTPAEGQHGALFTWLDGLQAAFAGYLAYVAIFSVLPFSSESVQPVSTTLLVRTYDIENAVLVVSCALRLLAAPRAGEERRFYRLLLTFLATYAVSVGLYNHLAVSIAGNEPLDTLETAPFVMLAVLMLVQPDRKTPGPGIVPRRSGPELFIDTASPVFFTISVLSLGLWVMRTHFTSGIVAIAVGLVVYGIRTTALQTRYLRTQQELQVARDRLEAISLQDGLTGIANRRRFDQTLEMEWHRALRTEQPLALLLIDIDSFKHLNDTQGHLAGDRCLVDVATILHSMARRSGDLVARYGGEEFAVILPGTSLASAVLIAEHMRSQVAALRIANETEHGQWLTASFGAASHMPGVEDDPAQLIGAADRALYRAKAMGRNRVAVADAPVAPSLN